MQSRKLGAALAVVAVGIAVALFFVLRDEGDDESTTTATEANRPTDQTTTTAEKPSPPPEPAVAVIEVEGGEPLGGVRELEFMRGERIRFEVRSDVADHVHLHGYDVFMDVEAGQKVGFDLPATIEGVFEVELEDRVVPLAEITVNPG